MCQNMTLELKTMCAPCCDGGEGLWDNLGGFKEKECPPECGDWSACCPENCEQVLHKNSSDIAPIVWEDCAGPCCREEGGPCPEWCTPWIMCCNEGPDVLGDEFQCDGQNPYFGYESCSTDDEIFFWDL